MRLVQDIGARRSGTFGRVISGAVVDHQHAFDVVARPGHHVGDSGGTVIGGDEDSD
jgi:hypothetical protein